MQNFGRGPIIDQTDTRTVSVETCEDCGKPCEHVHWDPLWEIYGREGQEIALTDRGWVCWKCGMRAEYEKFVKEEGDSSS